MLFSSARRRRDLITYCNEAAGILAILDNIDGGRSGLNKIMVNSTLMYLVSDVPFLSKSFRPIRPAIYENSNIFFQGKESSAGQNLYLYSHLYHSLIWYLLAIKSLAQEFVSEDHRDISDTIDRDIFYLREFIAKIWKEESSGG